ncbi:hypothetical protein, partial [Actinacidiphila cocklensis]|uniref:hypothetical protein n=1 Tax=Actinacidiphila cocklensis TaxID=887465 RepID=UPI00203D5AC7
MAPDDAHDAYDTQGLAQALDQALAQAGVAAETKQHAYDVLTGLVGGEPDLAALARRLLHLDGSVVPDETVLGWLYELVVTADQAGRAYSPAAIGAFDLQRRGALGARSQLIDETGWLTGRDWTRDTNELQLDTYQVGDRNGRRLFGSHDAPWTQQRWVVSAVARRGLPVVADGEGNPLAVHDWEEFAELLEYDSEWQQPRSELVIVVDRAGERTLEGPAFVADRLNVRTWSANSRIIQFTAPDGERVLRLVGRGAVWIPNDPGQRSRAVLGSVADVNGVEIPDGQIVSTAMVGIDGQGTGGRFMLTPEQIAAEFLDRSQISNVEHFTYAEIETRPDGSARIVRESKAHRLPFPLPAYTMVFHFDGTVGQVPLIDGSSRDAPIDEIAGYHGRRGSFQSSVRPGDSVMALACKATRHRINADDPFGDPSAFQRAANMLGTPVVGANVRIGYAPKSGNYPDRYNLEVKDIRRPAGAGFETAYPELNAHQLQEWAQRLGGPLGQRPEEQQLLRWLRAARFAFGAKLGPDESNFERAMRAFQELDALRALDGDTGPLTLSKLWDITADYNKAKGLEQSWAGLLLLLDEVLSLTGRGVPSAPVEALESAVDMSAPGLDSLAEPVVVGL